MSNVEDNDSVGTAADHGQSSGDGNTIQHGNDPSNGNGQRSGKRIRITDYEDVSSDEEERVRSGRGRKRRMPSEHSYDSRNDYERDFDRRGPGYPPYYQGSYYGPPELVWWIWF